MSGRGEEGKILLQFLIMAAQFQPSGAEGIWSPNPPCHAPQCGFGSGDLAVGREEFVKDDRGKRLQLRRHDRPVAVDGAVRLPQVVAKVRW